MHTWHIFAFTCAEMMHRISAWITPFLTLWCRAACSSEWRRNHAYFWMANTLARPGIVSCRFSAAFEFIWAAFEFRLSRLSRAGAYVRQLLVPFGTFNHWIIISGRILIYVQPHLGIFSAVFWFLFSRVLFLVSCVLISFQLCLYLFSAVF